MFYTHAEKQLPTKMISQILHKILIIIKELFMEIVNIFVGNGLKEISC